MAIQQPVIGDKLISPDHSLSHRVFANDDSAPVKSVVADSAGNIGIGTETPDAKLQVVGTVKIGDDNTNFSSFDNTGHETMTGNARPWRDELSDAVNLQQSGSGVSRNITENEVGFTSASTYNATFSLSDALVANIQLNHDKDLASSIYPHIHFIQEKNYAPNFLLEYRWQKTGDVQTTTWTKLKCNTLAFTYTSGSLNQIAYSVGIAVPAGTGISDVVQFRIFRDNANSSGSFTGTDPYNTGGNATVGITAFDIHFQINSLGSTDEYTK